MSNNLTTKRNQVVHLVHGILTHADWQPRVIQILEGVEGLSVIPTRYGKFGLLSFLLPGPTRNPPIRKTLSDLLEAQKRAEKSNSTLTVIAHSYGTYAIYKILSDNPAIKIDNLILCGAVKGHECNWQSIREANDINVLINDYGTMDLWPAMAASFTWGYGNGGTYGIGEPFEDRRHPFRHSDFFDDKFVKAFWLPFFQSGTIVPLDYKPFPQNPRWFRILDFPWRWAVWPALLMALLLSAAFVAGWQLYYPVAQVGFSDDTQSNVRHEIRSANELLRVADQNYNSNSVYVISYPSILSNKEILADGSYEDATTDAAALNADNKTMKSSDGKYLDLLTGPTCSKRKIGLCSEIVLILSRPGLDTSAGAEDILSKEFYRYDGESGNRIDIFLIPSNAINLSGDKYETKVYLCGRFNQVSGMGGQIFWEFEPGDCQSAKLERTLAKVLATLD